MDVFSIELNQEILKNFQDYDLGGKSTYKFNITLLFNLQVLCFIKRDKVPNQFKKLTLNLI